MLNSATQRRLIAASVLLLLAGGAWALIHYHTRPTAQSQRFADGTEAFFYSDAKISAVPGFPKPRELKVDGEFFLRIPEDAAPMIVHTRLMTLTVTGKSAIRIIAHSHETGEQVDVLYGHVQAKKAYKSHYDVPDELDAGQMVMINITIDLMEKETCDLAELKAWSDAMVAAAATGARKKS